MDRGEKLIKWYLNNHRNLPWRETRDPYKIWLSEIILQQTRIEQGLDYYLKFVHTYPNVGRLADASEDEVLKLWQGLGYYSRARNLHATAKHIAYQLNGEFPSTYSEIIKLKGVGPYTAAAISSFAFDEPQAVVDGNVIRVLSRIYDETTPANTSAGKRVFQELANGNLYRPDPGIYNQAIMELGSQICKPTSPKCTECPWNDLCMARKKKNWNERPVKLKSKPPKKRIIDYVVLETDDSLIFRKRTGNDIWKGLHDFDSIENVDEPTAEYLKSEILKKHPQISISRQSLAPEREYSHILSHQKIEARFWRWETNGEINQNSIYLKVLKEDIDNVAVPRLVHKYLEDIFSI
jgi:A/G-specific adenine glycosylase